MFASVVPVLLVVATVVRPVPVMVSRMEAPSVAVSSPDALLHRSGRHGVVFLHD